MQKYNLVVCGGTFDHFHKGHKEFLRFVLFIGEQAIIGLTTENYLKKNKPTQKIEAFEYRKKIVTDFLKAENALNRVEIVPLDEVAGPTLFDPKNKVEAVIVSEETQKGGEYINKEREKRGLSSLKIIQYALINGKNHSIISSSQIREGIINREGELYISPLWEKRTFYITPVLKSLLSKPFGKIYQSNQIDFSKINSKLLITVGDVVTTFFNENKTHPKMSIIDFYVQRKKTFSSIEELGFVDIKKILVATNPAGSITPSLFQAVQEAVSYIKGKKQIVIKVDGEEDLSVLPVILAFPLGFTIFYGQKGKGMVKVLIDEEVKKKAFYLLNTFNSTRGY